MGSLREQLPDLVEILADLLGIEQTATAPWRRCAAGRRARTFDKLTDYISEPFRRAAGASCSSRTCTGPIRPRASGWAAAATASARRRSWPVAFARIPADLGRRGTVSSCCPSSGSRREHSAAIVDLVTEGGMLSAELPEQILAATDGVPLFVEELTKSLLEAQGA